MHIAPLSALLTVRQLFSDARLLIVEHRCLCNTSLALEDHRISGAAVGCRYKRVVADRSTEVMSWTNHIFTDFLVELYNFGFVCAIEDN